MSIRENAFVGSGTWPRCLKSKNKKSEKFQLSVSAFTYRSKFEYNDDNCPTWSHIASVLTFENYLQI